MRDFIIDKPQWQTAKQRAVFGSVTLLFWAFWIYLWLPVLAAVGWLLGFRIAYREMVERRGYVELVEQLGLYGFIVACLGGSLLLWAYYNYFRFRGVERRKERPPVTLEQTSARYQIELQELGRWTGAARLVIHHGVDGRVIRADQEPPV
jgi:biofilm PGA synthesis protein PgaD